MATAEQNNTQFEMCKQAAAEGYARQMLVFGVPEVEVKALTADYIRKFEKRASASRNRIETLKSELLKVKSSAR